MAFISKKKISIPLGSFSGSFNGFCSEAGTSGQLLYGVRLAPELLCSSSPGVIWDEDSGWGLAELLREGSLWAAPPSMAVPETESRGGGLRPSQRHHNPQQPCNPPCPVCQLSWVLPNPLGPSSSSQPEAEGAELAGAERQRSHPTRCSGAGAHARSFPLSQQKAQCLLCYRVLRGTSSGRRQDSPICSRRKD